MKKSPYLELRQEIAYLNLTPVSVVIILAVLCPKPNIPPPGDGNLNPPFDPFV